MASSGGMGRWSCVALAVAGAGISAGFVWSQVKLRSFCASSGRSAEHCEDFFPSGADLRQNTGFSGAILVQSIGAEEEVEGYRKGLCVTGVWTRESIFSISETPTTLACVRRCTEDARCVGALWGELRTLTVSRFHCFLAGAGDGPTIIGHRCSRPRLPECSQNITYKALADLAPTFSCWQKVQQRCTSSLATCNRQALAVGWQHVQHVLDLSVNVIRRMSTAADAASQSMLRQFQEYTVQFSEFSGWLVALTVERAVDGIDLLGESRFLIYSILTCFSFLGLLALVKWFHPRSIIDTPPLQSDPTPYRPSRRTIPRSASPGMRNLASLAATAPTLAPTPAPTPAACSLQLSSRAAAVRDSWAYVEESPEAASPGPLRQLDFDDCAVARDHSAPSGLRATQISKTELLDILNNKGEAELCSLYNVGDKIARKILRYRGKGLGELTCLTDLATKVGVHKSLVTKFMRHYNCE